MNGPLGTFSAALNVSRTARHRVRTDHKPRAIDITLVTAWDGEALMGCGALKEVEATHGEVKSMRTDAAFQGRGVGAQILT